MNTYLSDKIRVISLITMVLLTLVHAYTYPTPTFTGDANSWDGLDFFIQYFISQGLARFRVPMFFILSGYFYFTAIQRTDGTYLSHFIKRIKTIALPYLLWSVIGMMLYALMQWPMATRAYFTHTQVYTLSIPELLYKILFDPVAYQLWFLRDLMVVFTLSPIILPLIRKFGAWAMLPPMLLWILEVDLVVLSNEALPFFVAGGWLALYGPAKEPALKDRTKLMIVLSWLLLVLVKTLLVLYNTVSIQVVNHLHHLAVFMGLLAVWVGYDLVVQERDVKRTLLYRFTVFTFFIYVSHEPLLSVVKNVLFVCLGHHPMVSLMVYLLTPLITIVLCLAFGTILLQHAPALYGMLTGGRGVAKRPEAVLARLDQRQAA